MGPSSVAVVVVAGLGVRAWSLRLGPPALGNLTLGTWGRYIEPTFR